MPGAQDEKGSWVTMHSMWLFKLPEQNLEASIFGIGPVRFLLLCSRCGCYYFGTDFNDWLDCACDVSFMKENSCDEILKMRNSHRVEWIGFLHNHVAEMVGGESCLQIVKGKCLDCQAEVVEIRVTTVNGEGLFVCEMNNLAHPCKRLRMHRALRK